MPSQAALYPGSLVGAAAAAGICGGLLLGFVAGLLSMAPISRLLAKNRRRSRRRREAWQLPFGQKEKVDVLPVFDEQAQVSPHDHFQAHGRVPSNMPSTPTLTDGAPHSRKGTLVGRAGMSHPSPSMEYVSSPAVTARSTSRSAHDSPINFSLPSQSLRDPYSLRRPPTAVRKGSADSVKSSPSRPVYNLFTRRPSSHSRQPSCEDSHRFAPQPLSHPATPQQRVPHHHPARSDDSSIMALYAAAQQIAEVQGSSRDGSGRPSLSRGTPHQRPPQAPGPRPAMADVVVQPARSHLREGKPALSRLSERTNERSMTLDDTSHTTSFSSQTSSSLTASLPKRGVLPAEPPGPSWDAGTLQARGRAQVSSSSYDPDDAHLATLRKLVSAIHEHDGVATAHQLGSRFSPDTPWVRRTPGGSPAVVGSYFERGNGDTGAGNESHEAQVEEPSVQRFSAESPVIPRNSQVMYIDSSLESRSPPTSPVRSSQISSGGGGVALAASVKSPSRRTHARTGSSPRSRPPLPRTPSLTLSDETVRPGFSSPPGQATLPPPPPKPQTQPPPQPQPQPHVQRPYHPFAPFSSLAGKRLSAALTNGGGSGDGDGSYTHSHSLSHSLSHSGSGSGPTQSRDRPGTGDSAATATSTYGSIGYGRHLSKVGTFHDYIKTQQQQQQQQQGSNHAGMEEVGWGSRGGR